MKLTKSHKGINIEFEENDSFELKRYAQLQVENSWEFIKMKDINDKLFANQKDSEVSG